MKNKITLFLFLLFVFYNLSLIGQLTNINGTVFPQIFASSPNAAALGNYGNYKVDMFTGQPSIGINLFDLKVGDNNFPVNLNYNLSSIRPEEHPGWVGLGWGLNIGGVITRLVRGGVDEVLVSDFTDPTIFSYYDHYSRLDASDWDSDTKLNAYMSYMRGINPKYFGEYANPDEFTFNVNGLSGSFFKNHKGQWVVKANQNIDIKIKDTTYTNYPFYDLTYNQYHPNEYSFNIKRIIYGFELSTSDGYTYIFGKTPNSIEFDGSPNIPNDSFHPNIVAKSWYLTKIITPQKKEIGLNYKTSIEKPPLVEDPDGIYYRAVFKQNVFNYFFTFNFTNSNGTYTNSKTYPYPFKRKISRIYPVYLDSVSGLDFTLKLYKSLSNEMDYPIIDDPNYANWGDYKVEYDHHYLPDYNLTKHWYKLDSIQLTDNMNNKIKTFDFNYIENADSRLFLSKISESGKDTVFKKDYIFEYDPLALPSYNSGKVDHWGYYNNNLYNGSWTRAGLESGYFNSKNPNASVLKAGTLTKIIYPTGGYTVFTYEPHEYYKYVKRDANGFNIQNSSTGNTIAGGLRIKKIASYDTNSTTPLETEYLYVNDYKNGDLSSSGVLSGIPNYIEKDYELGSNYTFNLNDNPIVYLNDTNGNHLTYTKVVEKYSNGGFKEFTFSNHDNGYMDNVCNNVLLYYYSSSGALNMEIPFWNNNSVKTSFNKRDMERGNILNEKIYNSSKELLEETQYFYSTSQNNADTEIRFIDYKENLYGDQIVDLGIIKFFIVDLDVKEISANRINSSHLFLNKTENYRYDLTNNRSLLNTKDFTYSNQIGFHQLKTETLNTSIANENKQYKYSYASDPEMTGQPGVNCLIEKNMTGIPLKTETYRDGIKLSEQLTEYAGDASTSNLCLPKYVYTKKGNTENALEKKITYDLYDGKGNLQQYTQENSTPVSIVWGYNQTQPIAKIEGVAYGSLPTTYVTAAVTVSNADNDRTIGTTGAEGALRTALKAIQDNTALKDAQMTYFTYDPLIGITSVTDPKGDIQYYFYDDFNRLQYVKDKVGNILNEYQYHYKGGSTIPTTYTVGYVIDGGTGSVSLSQTTVNSGGSVTVTLAPGSGYQVEYVKVGTTTYTVTNNTATIPNITSNTTINVKFQTIPTYTLSVSPTSLYFLGIDVSQTVSVSSNTSWTVSSNVTWLTLSKTSGSGNNTFTVRPLKNDLLNSSRSGTVTVSGGGITKTISITQDPME